MGYLTTVGLEVHVQLKTKSKMFCGCPTGYAKTPNTLVCPVCLGYPGAMPVMNKEAVHLTVISGLMIGSHISEYSKFDRKSYFYPDMPKNYQITQFDKPFCEGGSVTVTVDGVDKVLGVTRIHLEEDVGKSTHLAKSSGVDFNRAGHPLMEIVSEPDMTSPEEAYAYLQELRQILLYAGVSYCNLEEGNMRCDVNVSLRPEGQKELGTRAELKNLNSFHGVLNSLHYEVKRQSEALDRGEKIVQETRRWDPDRGITTSMRIKEDAHDYRYFPEPDLMPVVLDREQVAEWKAALPELPRAKIQRFIKEYKLPEYDVDILVTDRDIADYFENTVKLCGRAKSVSNWIMGEVMRVLGERECGINDLNLTPESLAELIELVEKKTINMTGAKEVFEVLVDSGGIPATIVKDKGLVQVSDSGAIGVFVDQAMAENPKSVEDYKNGKTAAIKFLIGQVMRLSRGKANPQLVEQMISEKLG